MLRKTKYIRICKEIRNDENGPTSYKRVGLDSGKFILQNKQIEGDYFILVTDAKLSIAGPFVDTMNIE